MPKANKSSNAEVVSVVSEHHAAIQQKAASTRKNSPQNALYSEFAAILASIIARFGGNVGA